MLARQFCIRYLFNKLKMIISIPFTERKLKISTQRNNTINSQYIISFFKTSTFVTQTDSRDCLYKVFLDRHFGRALILIVKSHKQTCVYLEDIFCRQMSKIGSQGSALHWEGIDDGTSQH